MWFLEDRRRNRLEDFLYDVNTLFDNYNAEFLDSIDSVKEGIELINNSVEKEIKKLWHNGKKMNLHI